MYTEHVLVSVADVLSWFYITVKRQWTNTRSDYSAKYSHDFGQWVLTVRIYCHTECGRFFGIFFPLLGGR